jgi:membrane protease YdiL (CAAX protease family)
MDSNRGGVLQALADGWRAIGLARSPLLADLTEADRVWWRPLLGLIVGAVGGFALVFILAIVIMIPVVVALGVEGLDPQAITTFMEDIQTPGYTPGYWTSIGLIWGLGIGNGLLLIIMAWLGSLLVKKPLRLSFTTAPRWRWGHLIGGLVLYGALLGIMMLIEILAFGEEAAMPLLSVAPTPGKMALFVLLSVPAWIFAAGVEELAFRGWILRHSAAVMRLTWIFLLFNGLTFSLIHWDFKPEHWDWNAFITRAVMGAGLCYMALRMGGIEFATGAHSANNLLLVLFIEPFNLAFPEPEPLAFKATVETLVMLVMMIGVTEAAIRVPLLARLIGPPSDGWRPQAANFE